MSALTGDITRRSANLHAQDFFTKPLDLPRLQQRIADLLHPISTAN
jgi:CheY-like chemotaxis protein